MPRRKKPARSSDLARAKKKAFDCLWLSIETSNPHEAATARKMAEQIAKKYGFTLTRLCDQAHDQVCAARAKHEVSPRPARVISRRPPAKPRKELELLRSAYFFFTGENPTPRAFERSLSKWAEKIADFLETVRER